MCDDVVEVATAKEETPGRNSLLCISLLGIVAQAQRNAQSLLKYNNTADQTRLRYTRAGNIESHSSVWRCDL